MPSGLAGGSNSNNTYYGTGAGSGTGWMVDPMGGYYDPTTGCYTDRGQVKCDAVGFAETYGSVDSAGSGESESPLVSDVGSGKGSGGEAAVIQHARNALYLALMTDADCLTFLGGQALPLLNSVSINATGADEAGSIAATHESFNPGSAPTYVTDINQSGPFFSVGLFYSPIVGGVLTESGTSRFQGFVLLHELGHMVNALKPDGPPLPEDQQMAAEKANNGAISSNCQKTLSSLSNVPK